MSDITFLLAVAALSLFLIVLVISLVFPKKNSITAKKQPAEIPEIQTAEFFPGQFDNAVEQQFPVFEARFTALNNKVVLAHERLQKIEELLRARPSRKTMLLPAQPSEEMTVLNKRVERLMDFKSNAEIELAAIKDVLREKGILKPLEQKSVKELRKKARQAEESLSFAEKKLHDLLYRAASAK